MATQLDFARDRTLAALQDAVERLERAVPKPSKTVTSSGHPAYRYIEKTPEQALVLKLVRLVSALRSLALLIENGLPLDGGAAMRIIDEIDSDVLFLSGPLIFGGKEPRHEQFLAEFFQEEFDDPNPVKASQKRNRVSRRDVRAYNARAYNHGDAVSDVVAVNETIDNAFSGFIHGAAIHVLDVFDGARFRVPAASDDEPVEAVRDQLQQYLHRSMMSTAVAAKALKDDVLFAELHALQRSMFNDYGDLL